MRNWVDRSSLNDSASNGWQKNDESGIWTHAPKEQSLNLPSWTTRPSRPVGKSSFSFYTLSVEVVKIISTCIGFNGLMAWFPLRVREVPGSIPGWALFESYARTNRTPSSRGRGENALSRVRTYAWEHTWFLVRPLDHLGMNAIPFVFLDLLFWGLQL